MMDASASGNDPVEDALAQLRQAFQTRLRAEQLRDQLTGLGNDYALTELLENSIEAGTACWYAFIEVDKFKSINEEFSYADADELLKRIGDRLRSVARDYFPAGATPIRAHGDEFFLVGALDQVDVAQIELALDGLRSEISLIRIGVVSKLQPMRCTVSIGWLISEDAQKAKEGLTSRAVRGYLELAVAQAKFDRDTVVRFTPDMNKARVRHDRADCGSCGTKFSMSIPDGGQGTADLACPNCSASVPRPPGLKPAPPLTSPPAGSP